MSVTEIGLVARARGLATRLLSREALERLAEADDFGAFARGLSRAGAIVEPLGEPSDVLDVERAVQGMAGRYFRTLQRWQQQMPGVLDVCAARQDHRSLRALLRGAAEGARATARLFGLQPTPSLPSPALAQLAHQATPADLVRQLVLLGHPDGPHLVPAVQKTQVDLLAADAALLRGLADRAMRAAAAADETAREFVRATIDAGNAVNALLCAGGPHDITPADLFVPGGQWLSTARFAAVAAAPSRERALTLLAAALQPSPLAPLLPAVPGDLVDLERVFFVAALNQLTRRARREPLSTAPLLRVLLLIEGQSHDLRALAWGAVLGTPTSLRKQQLVTPA